MITHTWRFEWCQGSYCTLSPSMLLFLSMLVCHCTELGRFQWISHTWSYLLPDHTVDLDLVDVSASLYLELWILKYDTFPLTLLNDVVGTTTDQPLVLQKNNSSGAMLVFFMYKDLKSSTSTNQKVQLIFKRLDYFGTSTISVSNKSFGFKGLILSQ